MSLSPFARVDILLAGLQPGASPINLTIGQPRHPPPDFIANILADHTDAYRHYPTIEGRASWRIAVANWLQHRYPELSGLIDPDQHILPLCGSREGLFHLALFARTDFAASRHKNLVLTPEPAYRCYAIAAAHAGFTVQIAESADPASSSLPDLDRLDPLTLDRTALFYLASPTNPQGEIAPMNYLQRAAALAQQHNFILVVDECYSELYKDTPPDGILAATHNNHFSQVISVNSLSKRSNLPGLRSGFCAGDASLIARFCAMRSLVAPTMPIPTQHAAAAVWNDETHVEASRALYQQKYRLADTILKPYPTYRSPQGGMFLWLDVGNGTATAQHLWRQAGLRTLPGRYLCNPVDDPIPSRGDPFLRIALVDDVTNITRALNRLIIALSEEPKHHD